MKIEQALKIAAEARRPRRPRSPLRLPPLGQKPPARNLVAYDQRMNLLKVGDMVVFHRHNLFHLGRIVLGPAHSVCRPNAYVVLVTLHMGGSRTGINPATSLRLRNQEKALSVWERKSLTRDTEDEFYAALEDAR